MLDLHDMPLDGLGPYVKQYNIYSMASYNLKVAIQTWLETDNFGLFDHSGDKRDTLTQKFTISEDCQLSCKTNSVDIIKERPHKSKNNGTQLISFQLRNNSYILNTDNSTLGDNELYRLIQPNGPSKIERIRQGDVLKLGLTTITILKLYRLQNARYINHYSGSTLEHTRSLQEESFSRSISSRQGNNEQAIEPTCRYCFEQRQTKENPILSCCACRGDTKYVHMRCLDLWLRDRMTVFSANMVIGFSKKGARCEVCNSFLDFRILLQLRYEPKITVFCVIEHSADKDYVYLLNLAKEPEFIIGRGHKSFLSINDETISRSHCKLIYNQSNGRFYVSDDGSKFGTLMRLNTNEFEESITLQLDNRIIRIEKSPKTNMFRRMFSGLCSLAPTAGSEDEGDRRKISKEQDRRLQKTEQLLEEEYL